MDLNFFHIKSIEQLVQNSILKNKKMDQQKFFLQISYGTTGKLEFHDDRRSWILDTESSDTLIWSRFQKKKNARGTRKKHWAVWIPILDPNQTVFDILEFLNTRDEEGTPWHLVPPDLGDHYKTDSD